MYFFFFPINHFCFINLNTVKFQIFYAITFGLFVTGGILQVLDILIRQHILVWRQVVNQRQFEQNCVQRIKAKRNVAWDGHSKCRIISQETPTATAAPVAPEPGSWKNYRYKPALHCLAKLPARGVQETACWLLPDIIRDKTQKFRVDCPSRDVNSPNCNQREPVDKFSFPA